MQEDFKQVSMVKSATEQELAKIINQHFPPDISLPEDFIAKLAVFNQQLAAGNYEPKIDFFYVYSMSNRITGSIKAYVDDVCRNTKNSFSALNKVGLLIENLPIPVQSLMLHNLLVVEPFSAYVEQMLKIIKSIFDTSGRALDSNLELIKTLVDAQLMPIMSTFIHDRYRANYDWSLLDSVEMPLPQLQGGSPDSIHFTRDGRRLFLKCYKAEFIPTIFLSATDDTKKKWTHFDLDNSCGFYREHKIDKANSLLSHNKLLISEQAPLKRWVTVERDKTSDDCVAKLQSVEGVIKQQKVPLKISHYYKTCQKLSHDASLFALGVSFISEYYVDKSDFLFVTYTCDVKRELRILIWDIKSDSFKELFSKRVSSSGTGILSNYISYRAEFEKIKFRHIHFAHNNKLLFVSTTNYGYCLLAMKDSNKIVDSLKSSSQCYGPSGIFSHDDSLLVVSNNETIEGFDTDTGNSRFTIKMEDTISLVKFSPDDLCLALVLSDRVKLLIKGTFEQILCKKIILSSDNKRTLPVKKSSADDMSKALINMLAKNKALIAVNYLGQLKSEVDSKRIQQLLEKNRGITEVSVTPMHILEEKGDTELSFDYGIEENLRLPDDYADVIQTGLSIDAGGMQGLIPAIILRSIENDTGCKIHQLFDCIGGSSVGGIIALGLTASPDGYQPSIKTDELVDFFYEHGAEIFPKSRLSFFIPQRFKSIGRYPVEPLERLLKLYFKDMKLSDALTQLLVASTELMAHDTPYDFFLFDSHQAQKAEKKDFYMSDIARATWATPSYFPPAIIKNVKQENLRRLVDGGYWKSNPAKEVYERIKIPNKDNMLLLSLGTGVSPLSAMHDDKAIDALMHTNSNQINQELREELGILNYQRWQPRLECQGEHDDTNPALLDLYIKKAEQLYKEKMVFVRRLAENKDRKHPLSW